MNIDLFIPFQAGDLKLANRLVMAPMARRRADPAGVPSEHAPAYYSQRASAGLVITEGTAPSPMGKGSLRMPGVYADAQVAAWRGVTGAVHAEGGRIVVQLMHSGRIAHSSRMEGRALPVAPSAVRPAGQVVAENGAMADYETPRALESGEIPGVIEEYAHAARCAMRAGFDGVELHGASGFLPMQFLSTGTNLRTDGYGGSVEKRARFAIEVMEAMSAAIGAGRVGIKISPENPHNDLRDDEAAQAYPYLVSALSAMHIAYLHVARAPKPSLDYQALLRPIFKGAFFAGGGLDRDQAAALVREGRADAAVFGVLFLANPDLPERFRGGAPLNPPDSGTFYTPGPKGYIDYPFLDELTRGGEVART